MRKLMGLLIWLLLFSLPIMAADVPKAELLGAYTYTRIDDGSLNDIQDQVSISRNFHGWIGSVTGNINEYIGIETEISNTMGTMASVDAGVLGIDELIGETGGQAKVKGNLLTIMAGPRITFRKDRVIPFVHALAGIGRFNASLELENINDPEIGEILDRASLHFTDNGFALAIGGGLDVKVKDCMSVRVGQFDYLMTNLQGFEFNDNSLESSTLNNFRIAFGLVFNLGSK